MRQSGRAGHAVLDPPAARGGRENRADVLGRDGAAAAHAHEHSSILVIDDEEIMREILETLLTREGYQVRLAATAAEGLELARVDAVRRRDRRRDDAGHGRRDRARRDQEDRRRPAGADDHRVRLGRERDRGDEARRLRLHQQAVQERRGARRPAQRAGAAPPGRREPRAAAEPAGARQPLRRDHRQELADAAGLRPDHPGGAEPDHDPDQRRERHRQGADRALAAPELGRAPIAPSSPSTPATCRRTCSSRTCSATSRGPSPARSTRRRGCSSWPTRGRSSSTRSATSRSRPRPSCCASSRSASSCASAASRTSRSTSASSPRPTSTCRR